jgi:hypothetical protein
MNTCETTVALALEFTAWKTKEVCEKKTLEHCEVKSA